MALQQVKIQTIDLQEGMYVTQLDRPWLETPYKVQGFLVKNQKDIDKLIQHTEYVFIDTERSREKYNGSAQPSRLLTEDEKKEVLIESKPRNYEDKTNFKKELPVAHENHAALSTTAENVMADIANNKKLDLPILRKAVNPMVESVIRNPEAFSWLTRMKSKDDYTYNHSVSTAIWSVALGRQLGLPKRDLQTLGMGALLFDVGKMKLPEKLINNPNRFSQAEFNLIKKHVEYSVDIVQSIPDISDNVVEMVVTHHERHNGSGYPNGLKGNKIPLFGKIAGITDCYDALTSDRPFQSATSPHDAVRKLYDWSNIDFQAELVEQFIQLVGVYPVGTIVELSDERVGIVVANHRALRLRPKIMLILDKNKKPFSKFNVIDMHAIETGEDGNPLNILKSIDPGLYGIDPREFYL
jgi:putative nucleotidyltransferase with HDIG domain